MSNVIDARHRFKSKKVYKFEAAEEVLKLRKRGHSISEACARLRISRQTYYDWFRNKKTHSFKVSEAAKERVRDYIIFNQADEDRMNEYLEWGKDDAS